MDRPYLDKGRKLYYEKGFGVELPRKEVKRKAERYLEEGFDKRHMKKRTGSKHYGRLDQDRKWWREVC